MNFIAKISVIKLEKCAVILNVLWKLQNKCAIQAKIDSIGDMKNFIENYHSFRKWSTKVSQHVLIISEMSKIMQLNFFR